MFKIHDVTQWEKTFSRAAALNVSISTVLSQLGWKPKNKQVFIKPNIGATSKIVNTDPEIVRGLIRYLQGIGIDDITIGEGSVETEYESTGYNFHHQGWDALAKEENVSLVDLNKECRKAVKWKYGTLWLPEILFGKTYINVAKMKTHMQTTVSLCTKNQKGILNSATRKQFHKLGLHEPIARLAEAIYPELCIVDGYIGIEGNGPGDWGTPRKVGFVVAGDNMVEVDTVCCLMMGVPTNHVEHLKLLREYMHYSEIPTVNVGIRPFELPDPTFKMFKTHLNPSNACTACLSSVGKTNKLARKTWRGFKVFLRKGLLSRLDIIVGSDLKELPKDHGYVIFYGDCTKELAKNSEYPFVPGCPPISKTAIETIDGWKRELKRKEMFYDKL